MGGLRGESDLQRCQGWTREGWRSGTNGRKKRCWLIQEVANLTRLPEREEPLNSLFFLPLMDQDTFKHEHWPQKKCKFVEFIPTHKWETQIDRKKQQKTELAPSESKDQLVIWLKADVIRTERVIRGSYPSSGHTGSGHTHSDTSFFPENPGEQLTSPAEVELSSDSLRQKAKQLHLHNIWVRTTGTECNGRPDTQTCG